MIEFAGHFLNWVFAAFLAPAMLVPIAALTTTQRGLSAIIWAGSTALCVGAIALFVFLVPSLRAVPSNTQLLAVAMTLVFGTSAILLGGGAETVSKKLAGFFAAITKKVGRLVIWLLLLMAIVQFTVVVLRYVFGVNFVMVQESITYMHAAVFLLAAGYALLTDDHVRVDIFYRGAPEKRKAIVDLFGSYFLLVPICCVLVWTASPYVANSWAVREGSTETTGIQGVFLLKSMIPLFASLLMMAAFKIATDAAMTLRKDQS